jgi:hypothetical protein
VPDPMIIADPSLRTPADREYWTSPEMYDPVKHSPAFVVSEVAKAFFGMSPGWVRHHLLQHYEVDGEPFELPRTPAGHRYFRLWDIERWAHALAERRVIPGHHLELTVTAVKTTAQLHRYLA